MSKLEEIQLHGHRVCFREAGEGPLIVLIHGITGRSDQWEPAIGHLAAEHAVLAPDLLGHGESAKPRADYSLGAYASSVRDLLDALGHERATVIGQSLGGGIVMQFAYQFPERCERLVLVSSGGLGDEVSLLLRALSFPGVEYLLPLLCARQLHDAGSAIGGWIGRLGMRPAPQLEEIWTSYGSLADDETRAAFVHTLRAVVDITGQRVSARDRLHLASEVPTLIMWGDRDAIIPVHHAYATRDLLPGSRLEIFEGVGHFPHCERPERFVEVVSEFMDATGAGAVPALRAHR
jgi:pimeloyl-ACP methyl ester carboxylesterase